MPGPYRYTQRRNQKSQFVGNRCSQEILKHRHKESRTLQTQAATARQAQLMASKEGCVHLTSSNVTSVVSYFPALRPGFLFCNRAAPDPHCQVGEL